MASNRYRVFFVDNIIPSATNRSDAHRDLLKHALAHKLPPLDIDTSKLDSGTVYLYPSMADKLEQIATAHGLNKKTAFAGLCAAAKVSKQAEETALIMGEKAYLRTAPAGCLKDARPEQARYYKGLHAGLQDNKIVMAEASTGIGKGRAIMAAAVDMARQKGLPVIVAAPTVTIMSQLYAEFEALGVLDVNTVILPGRSEFVDDVKLIDYIEHRALLGNDFDQNQAVTDWVRQGGPNLAENALSKTMRKMGVRPAWLMDDLVKIAGDFPADDFRLTRDSDPACASEIALEAYKNKTETAANIIICTHMMLALAQKCKWTILPKPSVVFIDEAHKFEEAVAKVNSQQLSLFSLRWRLAKFKRNNNLKSGAMVSKALKQVAEINEACRQMDDTSSQNMALNTPSTADEAATFGRILAMFSNLKTQLTSKSLNDVQDIVHDRNALTAMQRAFTNTFGGERIYLVFSPTKNYPSVFAGATRMTSQLMDIWNSATGGAVLASATLYIPHHDGTMRCDYIREILSIPQHRIYQPHGGKPIEASYIYSTPVLHYPRADKWQKLCVPSLTKENKATYAQEEKAWIKAAALEIYNGPATTAKGGTLVLCTAYSQLDMLAEELMLLGVMEERITAQSRDKKLELTRAAFIERGRRGIRPILIGLGGAGTGMNIKDDTVPDERAQDDLLMTDLVILRTPIGLNRTNTMLSRIDRRGTNPIEKEALLTLKQWLGRLIRREGVTDRHIWILDGRLWLPWKGMENFTKSVRQLFAKYKKSVVF